MSPPTLAFSRVTAPGAEPARWMILLHGIYGAGGNLRTLCRRIAERCPRWGFVLPDLRGHAGSLGLPPPHTVAAAAEDVARLEGALGHPVHALGGHSFGGKVALARLAAGRGALEAFVHLDSQPGARTERTELEQASRVLDVLGAMPWPLPTRDRFFELAAAAGLPRPIAEWLAMQVRRVADEERYELRLELPALRALLTDYFARDLWHVLESTPVRTLVLLGGRSTAFSAADRARLDAAARTNAHLGVAVLEGAGHWLHVDDLDGTVAAVARHLEPGPV